MCHKLARLIPSLFLAILVLMVTGSRGLVRAGEGGRPTIRIAPVEAPLTALPTLPEQAHLTVRTYTQALPAIKAAKQTLEELGGQLDIAAAGNTDLNCQAYFDLYQEVAAMPILDTARSDDLAQYASDQYNEAVANVLDTARDMYLTCEAVLKGTAKNEPVPFQRWGLSRWGVAKSVARLEEAIQRLNYESITLKPGESVMLTFTSDPSSEKGRHRITVGVDQPGQYAILLENANPTWSSYWVIWDYISLEKDNTPLWEIGEDETPPDYSREAFSEFCDPFGGSGTQGDCTTEFTVGLTDVKDFSKDLNDGLFPMARINFVLTDRHVRSELALVLSTLNAHGCFKMRVTLQRVTQP